MKQPGYAWRHLPHDLPPRSTVHYYFDQWTADGSFEEISRRPREQIRQAKGHAARPTAGVIDSQPAKSAGAHEAVGWDGGK